MTGGVVWCAMVCSIQMVRVKTTTPQDGRLKIIVENHHAVRFVVSFPVGEQFLKPVGPRMSTAVHSFLYVEVSNQGLVAKIKLAKSPPRGAGLGLGMVAVMIQQVFYGIPMYSNVVQCNYSTWFYRT